MKEYKNVRSSVRPEPRVIDEHSVWINRNIHEIHVGEDVEYEYDMTQYDKDEYIVFMDNKSTLLEIDVEANAEAIEELGALIGEAQ